MITREEKNKKYDNEIQREKAFNISKKIFHFIGIVFLTCFLLVAYIYFLGVKGLKVNEYIIKDDLIPKDFHGIKILHFTDLLYGSTIKDDEIIKLKEEIKLINPDIVVFTGNIVSLEYQLIEEEKELLSNFFKEIPYTIGKYAVKGEQDGTTFNLIMENTGFEILENEIINVYNNSKEFIQIIGLFGKNDKEIKMDEKYTMVLINNYDEYTKKDIKSNLVLAGHNLGGEIRLFNYPLLGNSKYNNRYYEEDNSKIYISSGLGSIHHMRFMNHPSINVYRLYAK